MECGGNWSLPRAPRFPPQPPYLRLSPPPSPTCHRCNLEVEAAVEGEAACPFPLLCRQVWQAEAAISANLEAGCRHGEGFPSKCLNATPQNAAASAGSCPLLCSLSRGALGAKEAERGDRERGPCFSLLPTLGALLNHSLLEGRALCASVMGPRPLCECREPLSFPGLCLCSSNSIFWHGHVCPRMFRCMCTCVTRLEGRG